MPRGLKTPIPKLGEAQKLEFARLRLVDHELQGRILADELRRHRRWWDAFTVTNGDSIGWTLRELQRENRDSVMADYLWIVGPSYYQFDMRRLIKAHHPDSLGVYDADTKTWDGVKAYETEWENIKNYAGVLPTQYLIRAWWD
jgi:hypothetical protein